MPADDPLLFLHLPKTAGTSLREVMSQAYTPDERAYIYDPADLPGAIDVAHFGRLPQEERAGFRLVMGHFPYGLHAHVPGQSRYVTMLREPVDRIVSLYYHFRTKPDPPLGSRAAALHRLTRHPKMSLDEWVFERRMLQADNGMLRVLSNRSNVPFGKCSHEMLSEALQGVEEHFDALLISSRMAQSMSVLEHVTGRNLPQPLRRNSTKGRPMVTELDVSLAERIRSLNEFDAELFRVASARLDQDANRLVTA